MIYIITWCYYYTKDISSKILNSSHFCQHSFSKQIPDSAIPFTKLFNDFLHTAFGAFQQRVEPAPHPYLHPVPFPPFFPILALFFLPCFPIFYFIFLETIFVAVSFTVKLRGDPEISHVSCLAVRSAPPDGTISAPACGLPCAPPDGTILANHEPVSTRDSHAEPAVHVRVTLGGQHSTGLDNRVILYFHRFKVKQSISRP